MKVVPLSSTSLNSTNAPVDAVTAAYAAGTTYAVGAIVKYQVNGIWMKYRSLKPSNVGKTPPDYTGKTIDGTSGATVDPYWIEIGATNEWAALDGYGYSRTVGAVNTALTFQFSSSERNALALMDMKNVLSVRVVHTYLGNMSTILDQTFSMSRYDTLTEMGDWYQYFFGQQYYATTLWLDLAPWTNSRVDVTITPITDYAPEVGVIACGKAYDIGDARWGVGPALDDYSTREIDKTTGVARLSPGRVSASMKAPLWVPTHKIDQVWRHLQNVRGQACLWSANQYGTAWDVMIVFGYLSGFDVSIPGPDHSECSLTIGGLI